MEHVCYPFSETKISKHGKWESCNKLRVVISSRNKSHHRLSSCHQLDSNFLMKRDSSKSIPRSELNKTSEIAHRLPRSEPIQGLYSQKASISDIDQLLLLEHDLFSESKQQVAIPVFTKEIQRRDNSDAIELKGEKVKVSTVRVFCPIHKSFKKIALQQKPPNQRSHSVNKSNKKGKVDTPSPWGFENSPDSVNNFQKLLPN